MHKPSYRRSHPRAAGYATALSEFLRELRYKEGLSQAQLGRALGVTSAQYVSKVETARIAVPSREFLEALATRTGQSVERLVALSRQAAAEEGEGVWQSAGPPASRPFKLVFGHCLWGAPIFLAAHRGMIPEFSVASYALRGQKDDGGAPAEPAWIQPDELRMEVPGPSSEHAEPWSAVKILDLLEKETIDIGAIPGNVIWGRGTYQRFMRIGTIVDSATGCTFVCDARSFPTPLSILSTRELFDLVLDYTKNKESRVRIAAEVGTVADNYLQRAFQQAEQWMQGKTLSIKDRKLIDNLRTDEVRWHCNSSELAHTSFSQLREACAKTEGAELVGVITWEPHASWLEACEGKKSSLKKFPLHFSPDKEGRLTHMSFDLVMLRTSGVSRVLRMDLTKLMQKLWQNATLLSELDGTSFDTDPLRRVATYFGFPGRNISSKPSDEVARQVRAAIRSIRYSVHWAMESQPLFGAFTSE